MKRLDTINDRVSEIHTLLLHFVDGKCSCLLLESSKANAFISDHKVEKEEWITINEALYILKISRRTLFRLRKSGKITSREMNHSVRLLKSDVLDVFVWYSVPKGKV